MWPTFKSEFKINIWDVDIKFSLTRSTNLIFAFLLRFPFVEKMFELHDWFTEMPSQMLWIFSQTSKTPRFQQSHILQKKKENIMNNFGSVKVYFGLLGYLLMCIALVTSLHYICKNRAYFRKKNLGKNTHTHTHFRKCL